MTDLWRAVRHNDRLRLYQVESVEPCFTPGDGAEPETIPYVLVDSIDEADALFLTEALNKAQADPHEAVRRFNADTDENCPGDTCPHGNHFMSGCSECHAEQFGEGSEA